MLSQSPAVKKEQRGGAQPLHSLHPRVYKQEQVTAEMEVSREASVQRVRWLGQERAESLAWLAVAEEDL